VLRIGRLLVVDDAPEPVEELLADYAGKEARGDRDGDEEQLSRRDK
jgi:hypothetical protein